MALPYNVHSFLNDTALPFFSPYPVSGAAGVNIFAQISHAPPKLFSNPYVFPPICLIPQVLRFFKSHSLRCTFVVPDIRPRQFWWPLLQTHCSLLLGSKGTTGIVLLPSNTGFSSACPLPWDLWAFQISFS